MNAQRLFSISEVELEAGLTKDILRKWETRFGFPLPSRKPNGERFYSRNDVDRLMAIKRLLDSGMRPSVVVPLSFSKLNALASQQCAVEHPWANDKFLKSVWQVLKSPDPSLVRSVLSQSLVSSGLREFVLSKMPELINMVGRGWESGELAVHQEHVFSECISSLLLESIGRIQPLPGSPRVLMSTPPEERHDLGLLMLHSILALTGAQCISLGAETPGTDLVAAANSYGVNVVALSFSIAYPSRRILPFLEQVRAGLPDKIQLWAGGAGVEKLRRKLQDVQTFASLELAAEALIKSTNCS